MKKTIYVLLAVAFIISCVAACRYTMCKDVYRYTENEFYSMSTFVEVISDNEGDGEEVERYFDSFENRLSRTRSGSEIYELNKNGKYNLSSDTEEVLKKSVEISQATDYAFNPCLGTITELWDITSGKNYVPAEEEILSALEKCRVENLSLFDGAAALEDGTRVDLGAVAKGYALEKAMERASGENVCISLGGNVAVRGSSESRKNMGETGWLVGITNPFDNSQVIGNIILDSGFVSVSGSYERYFEKDGEIYHHIFDGKTGKPCDSDLASAVVISGNGLEADALSTALFVMGRDKAVEFFKGTLYEFDMILITKDGEIYISENINKTFALKDDALNKNGKKMTITEIDKQEELQ